MLFAFAPLIDTVLLLEREAFSGEGDIPVEMATVSGDTLLVSTGRRIYRFRIGDGAIEMEGKWTSPVAFDDMMLWRGHLYLLSRGEGGVYVLGGDGEILDTIPIPYGYLSRFLYLFRTPKGIYMDIPGDSSFSILEKRAVPDPVAVEDAGGAFVLRKGSRTFRLPPGVVSASFVGEDGNGNAYLYLERAADSGVETGIGILGADGLRVFWAGRFEMEGYIPRPMEVGGDGSVFLFAPADSGIRVQVWGNVLSR